MSRQYFLDLPDWLAKKVQGRATEGFHSVTLSESEWEQLVDAIDSATYEDPEEPTFVDLFVAPAVSELLRFAKENSTLMGEIFKASIKHTTKR